MPKYRTIYDCKFCKFVIQEDTLESLQEELKTIKSNMETIKKMDISNEVKAIALVDLQAKISDVKKRMHDVVDEL